MCIAPHKSVTMWGLSGAEKSESEIDPNEKSESEIDPNEII